jgi:isocitrate dehydrogenase
MDSTPEVIEFAETLERVCVETVESGKMTKDLALLVGGDQDFLTTEEFLAAIDENLRTRSANKRDDDQRFNPPGGFEVSDPPSRSP